MNAFKEKVLLVILFMAGISLLIGLTSYQDTRFNLTQTVNEESIEVQVYTSIDKKIDALIKEANSQNINIYLVKSGKINAFTNGKDIYLYTGLLDLLTNDAIYITIRHEMGHIVKNHLTRHNVILDKYFKTCEEEHPRYVCEILLGSDKEMLRVSRGFEYEADMYAFIYAKANDIPVTACNELFKNLGKTLVDTYSTHPATHKRLKQCENYINDGTEAYFPTYETLREQELITF